MTSDTTTSDTTTPRKENTLLCTCNGSKNTYCPAHGDWVKAPAPTPALSPVEALLNVPAGLYPPSEVIYVYLDEDTARKLDERLYSGQREGTPHHINSKVLKMERGDWQDDGPEECLTLMRCRRQVPGCEFPVAPWEIVLTNGQGRVGGTLRAFENIPNYRSYVARIVLKTVETDADIYNHYFYDTDTGTSRGVTVIRAAHGKALQIPDDLAALHKKILGALPIVQMRLFQRTAAMWRVSTAHRGVYDPTGNYPIESDWNTLHTQYAQYAVEFAKLYDRATLKDSKDRRNILKGFFYGNGCFAPAIASMLPGYVAQGVKITLPTDPSGKTLKAAVPGRPKKQDWLFCSDPSRYEEFWDGFLSGDLDPKDIRARIREDLILAGNPKSSRWYFEKGKHGDIAMPSRAAICMMAWQLFYQGLHLDPTIQLPAQFKSLWPTTRPEW